MKNYARTRCFLSLVATVYAVFLLSSCGYPKIEGQWQPLESPVLVFTGVQLPDKAKDSAYPEVCTEAVKDINEQLSRKLPGKIKPLTLAAEKPSDNNYAELQMQITECKLDSDQAGDNFSFYLDLNLDISVKDKGVTLMHYSMKTSEQAQTDTPDPSWIFTFEEPFRRTLMLFENGKALAREARSE